MPVIWAKHALLPDGWADDVSVAIDDEGRIGAINTGQSASQMAAGDTKVGILLPAPSNVHSHLFQRAMAGLTEQRGRATGDSFWTWRRLMYRFLERLTPDDVEAIAAFGQMEMLEAGYATNVEFHYLHHQPSGGPYNKLAEMAERIMAAASQSGVGLTLLPVHYQYGGCDKRALGAGQVRFGNDFARFERLWVDARKALQHMSPDCHIGVAAHSLRAVAPEDLPDLIALAEDRPMHMHLAEQTGEVEEVEAAWGKRPVEWLLENANVDGRWCLIHCTQMEPHETRDLANTGAVAGLCPITESSLGDGIFDGVRWVEEGGHIAVGSDSNIRISLSEELRTLEYSQRLKHRSRAVFATAEKSTGRRLFDAVSVGGARAAGRNAGAILTGLWADLMVLDDADTNLIARKGDTLLDCYIFAGDDRLITDVWSAGRHMVKGGRHIDREAIAWRYLKVMENLQGAI